MAHVFANPKIAEGRSGLWAGLALMLGVIIAGLLMPASLARLSDQALVPLSDWVGAALN